MTGELLSLELIELKIFEHFIRLQNLKEINIHDVHDQIQGHLLAHAGTRDISFYMLYDIPYSEYHICRTISIFPCYMPIIVNIVVPQILKKS